MKFLFSLFTIFILLKKFKFSKITIPFKVQNYSINKNSKSSQIINDYIYKDIIVNLTIGNPAQKIQLSPCLGEYTTFIISKDSDGFEGGTYNKSLSKTYRSLENNGDPQYYTFQTFSEGIKSKDNFLLEKGEAKINDLEFILATEIGGNNCYNPYCEKLTQPGILGFEISQLPNQIYENVSNTNFISQLKQKDLISDYYFNFHFKDDNNGDIVIGLKPDEYESDYYKKENFVFIKTTISSFDYLDWSVAFDNIYYGKNELANEKPLLLRIEYGLINGYYEWEKTLKNEFFDELITEKKCFKNSTNELGSTAYYYYCNKSTDISKFEPFIFSINEYNYNFTLSKDDLFTEVGDIYLFLMIFGGISDIILGYPFLKKYQLIFNQETKTIGFYKHIYKNDKIFFSNIVYYIIIIILLIILLILIIIGINLYLKRNKEKLNATELSNEEYEYNEEDKNKLIINENFIN